MNDTLPPSLSHPNSHSCTFKGTGLDLFLLQLKNAILTVLTLGIYAAWGKADLYRYYWSNTEVAGHRMRFTGNGKEIFKGLLLGIGILMALGMVYGGLAGAVRSPVVRLSAQLAFYTGLICLAQFAYYAVRRYRLSRTEYREIRFRLYGSPKEFTALAVKNLLLSVFSLGLLTPFFIHRRWEYIYNRMQYGSLKFRFAGNENKFLLLCLKGVFLSVFTLGIYNFWFVPALIRYVGDNLTLEDLKFKIHVSPWDFFVLGLGNILILILTLGLGFAWVQVRQFRFFLENLNLEGNLDLDSAAQIEKDKISAGSEGVAQALDLDLDIGF